MSKSMAKRHAIQCDANSTRPAIQRAPTISQTQAFSDECPAQDSGVQKGLSALGNSIAILNSRIEALRNRLKPVLLYRDPDDHPSGPEVPPSQCIVAQNLAGYADAVAAMSVLVDLTIEELDI